MSVARSVAAPAIDLVLAQRIAADGLAARCEAVHAARVDRM